MRSPVQEAVRLRVIQGAARRVLDADARGSHISAPALIGDLSRRDEPVWPSAFIYALVRGGALREVTPFQSRAAPAVYAAGNRELLEAIRDDREIAGFYVPCISRRHDDDGYYIPPEFREARSVIPGEVPDEPAEDMTLDEADQVTMSFPSADGSEVNEALLAALERVAGHLVATREDLARDRAERNAQTDLLLDIGGKLEKVASRDDLAEAIAELIAAQSKESPRLALDALREEIGLLRADVGRLGGETAAALAEIGRVVAHRLDTQRSLQAEELAATRAYLVERIDGILPDVQDVADTMNEACVNAIESVKKTADLLPRLGDAATDASTAMRVNGEIILCAAEALVSILAKSVPKGDRTGVVQRLADKVASATGETLRMHAVDSANGKGIETITGAPAKPSRVGVLDGAGLIAAAGFDLASFAAPDEKESKP